MSNVVDLNSFRFTHERAPARRKTDAALYAEAMARQRGEDPELVAMIGPAWRPEP